MPVTSLPTSPIGRLSRRRWASTAALILIAAALSMMLAPTTSEAQPSRKANKMTKNGPTFSIAATCHPDGGEIAVSVQGGKRPEVIRVQIGAEEFEDLVYGGTPPFEVEVGELVDDDYLVRIDNPNTGTVYWSRLSTISCNEPTEVTFLSTCDGAVPIWQVGLRNPSGFERSFNVRARSLITQENSEQLVVTPAQSKPVASGTFFGGESEVEIIVNSLNSPQQPEVTIAMEILTAQDCTSGIGVLPVALCTLGDLPRVHVFVWNDSDNAYPVDIEINHGPAISMLLAPGSLETVVSEPLPHQYSVEIFVTSQGEVVYAEDIGPWPPCSGASD